MGVHSFSKSLSKSRIIFTVQNESKIEEFLSDSLGQSPSSYNNLKYIGIDGSIFFHSYSVEDRIPGTVDINATALKISNIVCGYLNTLTYILYNDKNNTNYQKNKIILHFVMDGKQIYMKNRNVKKYKDIFSLLSPHEKLILEKCTISQLENNLKKINQSNDINYQVFLLSSKNIPFEQRIEGELLLYQFINKINLFNQNNSKNNRYIIISNDSDIYATCILRQDLQLIIICPPLINNEKEMYPCISISNYNYILKSIKMNNLQLFHFTLLYFIFFGSDYNLGLVSCWTKSKELIIKNAVLAGQTNIIFIFSQMRRNYSKANEKIVFDKFGVVNYEYYLIIFKLIIYEAIQSIKYYKSLGKFTPSQLLLYENNDIKILVKTMKL